VRRWTISEVHAPKQFQIADVNVSLASPFLPSLFKWWTFIGKSCVNKLDLEMREGREAK